MGRCVFFSFAYNDVRNFKVNVVRNSWYYSNKEDTFVDGSIWEKAKGKGDAYLKRLIENGLMQTSVTAVLIGENTANRRWINYEIVKSFERGNGIFAVHLNRIRSKQGFISAKGKNPLDRLGFEISDSGRKIRFYELHNGTWYTFDDLPEINNRKSNTLYFDEGWFGLNDFGKFFTFSNKFNTYCWVYDDGPSNFTNWIEDAAEGAGR